MNGSESTLELKNLTSGYPEKQVLKNVSLSFEKGLNVILGPNGSGKTTLFRTITGVLKPSSGSVLFEKQNLLNYPVKKRAHIVSEVLGTHRTASGITGYELAEMALYPEKGPVYRLSPTDKERLSSLSEKLSVSALLDRTLDSLSAGERQLTELLAAVYRDTPVLLLDEPVTSLDFSHTHEFMKTVKEISDNKTVIATLHDPSLALYYADRMVLFKDGQVAGDFNPRNLKEKEIENYLRILYPHIAVYENGGIYSVSYMP